VLNCEPTTFELFLMDPQEYTRMHALETNYWWFAGRRAIIGSLLQEVPQAPGYAARFLCSAADVVASPARLLDIGSGTGANLPLLRAFVGKQGRVMGMDFSPLALKFAQSHPESQGTSLLQGDALHLPFPTATFDVVTMLDVLEHLSDDRRALSEVQRVLRPGGVLVWSVPAYQSLWSAHDEALHHFRRYEYHALRRLLRKSGFSVWRLSFAMSLMPPFAWLWRRLVLPFQPHRPPHAKRHSEGAVLPTVPPTFNHALIAYLKFEGRIMKHRPLNFGTSLVGIAVKVGRRQ